MGHIAYLNDTNILCDDGKNRIKDEIKKTQMLKEEEKERVNFLEQELQNARQRKIEQEFAHQQKINDFETNKAAILNDNENLKRNLNSKIDELTDKLSLKQKHALETELTSNASKKSKEDNLTGKIHHFSNIECDFSKQIHTN